MIHNVKITCLDNFFSLMTSIVLAIVIIIGTGYYLVSVGQIKTGIVISVSSLLIFLSLVFRRKALWVLGTSTFIYLVLHITTVVLTFIANSKTESFSVTALIIMNDVFSLLLWNFYKKKERDFLLVFANVFFVLGVISLVGFFAINISNMISLPIVNSITTTASYESAIVYAKLSNSFRNSGVFWEPGIYAELLSFVMLIVYYIDGNRNKFKKIILFAFIILFTTLSTSGYVLCLFFLLLFIHRYMRMKGRVTLIIIDTLVSLLILFFFVFQDIVLLFLAELNPIVFGKIAYETINYTSRMNGPLVSLSIFGMAPLLGKGLEGSSIIFNQMNPSLGMIDVRVDTITTNLSAFGIWGLIPVVFLLYGIWRQTNALFYEKVLISIFMLFMLYCEPLSTLTILPVVTVFLLQNKYLLGVQTNET